MARPGHADVVGEVEAALERAGGDAAVEIDAAFVLAGFLRGDDQRVFADFDGEVFVGEAGDGDRDALRVIGGLLDVVGRVGRCAVGARALIEQRNRSKPTVAR